MITIVNHRIHVGGVPVEWRPTKHVGGLMEPQLILTHETWGHFKNDSAIEWLRSNPKKVSAHAVIRRDGSIVQLADLNRTTNHAGDSEWQGRRNLNGFAIGYELEGPGWLFKRGKDKAVSTFALVLPLEDCVEIDSSAHGGARWWLPYTDLQMETYRELCEATVGAYQRVASIAGHYEVSPGRKFDPSPLFPMDSFRMLCWDREAPDAGLVKAAQQRLVALGYDPSMEIDGLMGRRTRGALRTFQEANDLPITGEIDEATARRLAAEDAVPMTTGTRTDTTKADVQSRSTWWGKRGTEVEASRTLFDAVDKSGDAIGKFAKAKSTSEQGSVLIDWAMSPLGFKTLGTLALCGLVWFAFNNVDWQAVRARVKGLATGRA